MSDQYGPQPGYPVQPTDAPPPPPGYPAQQYGYPPQQYGYPASYAPPVPRPALTREQRVGAMLAGGIGFAMFSIGAGAAFSIVILALVAGILAAVFGLFIASSTNEGEYAEFQNFLDSFPIEIVVTVGIVAFLVAIALMIGGILVSIRILKKRGINSPGATTWSALGISVVTFWIASSVVGIVPSVLGSIAEGAFEVIVAIFSIAVGLALPVVIGAFAWWWMAHAMRARAAG